MRRTYSPLSAFAVAIVCLIGFGCLAYAIKQHQVTAFDNFFIRHIQGQENDTLTSFMRNVSSIGTTVPVIVIMLVIIVILLVIRRLWKESLFLIWVMLGQKLLNTYVKDAFERARPTIHRLAEETDYSFPSGHAMASICLYGAIVYLIWSFTRSGTIRTVSAVIAALIMLIIGASRIYLGVHYPTDIIGGYLLGGCWLAASAGAFRLIAFRATERKHKPETPIMTH